MDISEMETVEICGKKIPKYLIHEYAGHVAMRYKHRKIRPDLGNIMVFERSREALHDLILKHAGIKTCGAGGIFRCPDPELQDRDKYKEFEKALNVYLKVYILEDK